jgi:hypothetical protein
MRRYHSIARRKVLCASARSAAAMSRSRSWTLLLLGESDHPDSKHYDDRAEKHFSPGKLKPTYFLNKEEMLKHVESKKVLRWPLTSK